MRSLSPLVRAVVLQNECGRCMLWAQEQGCEGIFAYDTRSDNVEGLHKVDGVKRPTVKSFWLELHLNSILQGTN